MSGPFRPDELAGTPEAPSASELAVALATARELETALPAEPLTRSAGFSDRVMAAVRAEPPPTPAGYLAPLRRRPGLGGLAASVGAAWGVVTGGGGLARPAGARAMALAYVLAVVLITTSIVGLGAYGGAGALGLLDGSPEPSPSVPAPSAPAPSATAAPTDISTPTPAATPSPSPVATVTPGPPASAEPSPDDETPDPSESEEPSVEPSDDNSGPGSGGSARPSDTPEPSETPD